MSDWDAHFWLSGLRIHRAGEDGSCETNWQVTVAAARYMTSLPYIHQGPPYGPSRQMQVDERHLFHRAEDCPRT